MSTFSPRELDKDYYDPPCTYSISIKEGVNADNKPIDGFSVVVFCEDSLNTWYALSTEGISSYQEAEEILERTIDAYPRLIWLRPEV